MSARYLVDNSVWQRVGRDPVATAALRRAQRDGLVVTCPPQVLEYCHAARDRREYRRLCAVMETLHPADVAPTEADVLDLQQALWEAGLVRAAGTTDLLIAAYAIVNDAVVLSADRDFAHIARATRGRLRQEYVAPSR